MQHRKYDQKGNLAVVAKDKREINQRLQRKIRQDKLLLERLKIQFGVSSERALERRLKIPFSTLSRVMRGEGPLGWDHRFIIKDKLGFAAVRNGVASLLPKNLSEGLIAASHRQFLRGLEEEDLALEPQNTSEELLERLASSPMPGACESVSALNRFRAQQNIQVNHDLNQVEKAIIIETLIKADQKFWQPLIENLSACISSTESLLDLVSMEAVTGAKDWRKTNQLLDLLSTKLNLSKASDLARLLEVTDGSLSKVRNGKAKLPARSAFRMQCYLEFDSREEAEEVFKRTDNVVSDPDQLMNELKL